MTCSIRNFEKLNFTPKSSIFCSSQGQTSKYDRLAHSVTDGTALLSIIIVMEIANSNFLLFFLATFPRVCLNRSEIVLFSFSDFQFSRENRA